MRELHKYRVLVGCRNICGTVIYRWILDAESPGEAEHSAVEMARRGYPEFDEFEPVRTEEMR